MILNFLFDNGKKVKMFSVDNFNENYYLNIFIEHLVQSLGLIVEEESSGSDICRQSEKQTEIDNCLLEKISMDLMSAGKIDEIQEILDRYAVGFGLDKIVYNLCNEVTGPALIKKKTEKENCVIIPVFSKTEIYGFMQFLGVEKSLLFYKGLGLILAMTCKRLLDENCNEFLCENSNLCDNEEPEKTLAVTVNIPDEVFILCNRDKIKKCTFNNCFHVMDIKRPSLLLIKQSAEIDFADVVELVDRIRDLPEHSTTKIFYFWNELSSSEIKKYEGISKFVFCNEKILRIPEFKINLKRLLHYDCYLSHEVMNELNKVLFKIETNLICDVKEIIKSCDLTVSGINSRFVTYFGMPVLKYKKVFRVMTAKQIIDEKNNIDIDEVASLCGYDSSSALGYEFKKYYQMTPAEYIRKKKPEIAKSQNNR